MVLESQGSRPEKQGSKDEKARLFQGAEFQILAAVR